MKNLIFILTLLLSCCEFSNAQIKKAKLQDSTWIIEMKDDNTYIGKLVVLESNKLYELHTTIGVLTIHQEDIKSMKQVEAKSIHGKEYWPDNPHTSRYFFAPSAYGLRKGEGYYSNYWVLFNQVSYGFSNYFTMGAGIIPTFLFGTFEDMPFWLTPKFNFTFKNEKGAIGLGTIYFNTIKTENYAEDIGGFGLLYGSGTIGSREKQLTLGIGLGYADGEISNIPAFSVSGLVRTAKKWSLVTENYIIISENESTGLISAGARFMMKRLAIDFGGFAPIGVGFETLIILPWLGINVPFGKHY